jgi:transcription initiation factor TFIID TATA-box-binding protein
MRIREPRTTALVFKSGKMVITGAKNSQESQTAGKKYTAIIQKVGFDATFRDFKIQNISGTCDAGFPIKLESLLYAHPSNSTYEPEIFPGLVYRMLDPKVVFLVFVSGKVVITGAKTEDTLAVAFQALYEHLVNVRKKSVVSMKR